jgi:hypothetical protein
VYHLPALPTSTKPSTVRSSYDNNIIYYRRRRRRHCRITLGDFRPRRPADVLVPNYVFLVPTRRSEGRLSSMSERGSRILSRPVDSRQSSLFVDRSPVRYLISNIIICVLGIMTCGPPLGDHRHRRIYGWSSVFVTALGTLNISHVA